MKQVPHVMYSVTTHKPTQKPHPFTNHAVQFYFAAVKMRNFSSHWGSNVNFLPVKYLPYMVYH